MKTFLHSHIYIRLSIVVFLVFQIPALAEDTVTDVEGSTEYVSTDDFSTKVLEADLPVLVDFTATWCVPCREVDPIIDELAKEVEGKVKIFKLDIDNSPEVYQEYKVNGIPHILFFRDGVEEDRIGGAQAKSIYVEYVDGMIAGKSAHDITIEMLDGDTFRRYFILGRSVQAVKTAIEKVPNLLTEQFENGQTPLSLILNRPSVRQNDLITLTLSFDPEITIHDLVGLGRCEEFLEAIQDDPDVVNRSDPDGNTVLITAMMRSNRLGDKDCTDAVLSTDLDLEKQNSSSFALGRAIILQNDVELSKRLIELGWEPDILDENGNSALHWAAMYGYVDNVRLLLEHGSDPTLKYSDGSTILDYVERSYARSKASLEVMQADESTDFSDDIKTVKESISKLEAVLEMLNEQTQSGLENASPESTM